MTSDDVLLDALMMCRHAVHWASFLLREAMASLWGRDVVFPISRLMCGLLVRVVSCVAKTSKTSSVSESLMQTISLRSLPDRRLWVLRREKRRETMTA